MRFAFTDEQQEFRESTEAVLADVGYSAEEIAMLAKKDAVGKRSR